MFNRLNNYLYSKEGVILCIIIRDAHQFIGHCLIPLDPCEARLLLRVCYGDGLVSRDIIHGWRGNWTVNFKVPKV